MLKRKLYYNYDSIKKMITSKKRSGSILIEMGIGLMLLSVVLLGIMATFVMTMSASLAVRDKETASAIALDALNEAEGAGFAALSGDAPFVTGNKFSVERTVVFRDESDTALTGPSGASSALVTVSVGRSQNGNGVTMSRELSSYGHKNAGASD